MTGDIPPEAFDKCLRNRIQSGNIASIRPCQANFKFAIGNGFTKKTTDHKITVASPVKQHHFALDISNLGQLGNIGRKGQNIAQSSGATVAFLGHHPAKGTVTLGDFEAVDLRRCQFFKTGVHIAIIINAKRIIHLAQRQQTEWINFTVSAGIGVFDRLFGHIDKTAHSRQAVRVASTTGAFLEQAQHRHIIIALDFQCAVMPVGSRLGDGVKLHTTHGGFHIREIFFENRIIRVQKIRLEKFTARIAFNGTQANLAHGFHQRFFSRFGKFEKGFGGIIAIFFLGPHPHSQRINRSPAKAQRTSDMMRR